MLNYKFTKPKVSRIFKFLTLYKIVLKIYSRDACAKKIIVGTTVFQDFAAVFNLDFNNKNSCNFLYLTILPLWGRQFKILQLFFMGRQIHNL